MSRNVFLSFLGTNDYIECNYGLEGKPSEQITHVKYIQEALIKLFCMSFAEKDSIIILSTELAEKLNYADNGQWNRESKQYDKPNEGLGSRLKLLEANGLKASFKSVRIKEGYSESEIWDVFDVISQQILPNDQIYLDVTHAFRYLPMLGVVLTDFLRVTKEVSIKGVYYGAFEKLGFAETVKNTPVAERNAPILNLLPLIELQRWSTAANNFYQYGVVENLIDLANEGIKPILKETKGSDLSSNKIRHFSTILQRLVPSIQTNRGKDLMNFDQAGFKTAMEDVQQQDIFIKPLKEIFSLIQRKVTRFTQTKVIWLESAEWCLKHNLIQQGWTQLQEGVLTYLVDEVKQNFDDPFFDSSQVPPRNLLSSVLNIIHFKTPPDDWNKEAKEYADAYTNKLLELPLLLAFAQSYSGMTGVRNDISHGGYKTDATTAKKLVDNLEIHILAIRQLIANPTI